MEKAIGTLCGSTFSFHWKIENFSSLPDKNASAHPSPPFDCFDAVWNLLLYPNGYDEETVGRISVFLEMLHPKDSERMVNMKFSGECDDKIMATVNSANVEFSVHGLWGCRKFLRRAEVLETLRTALQKVVIISCVVILNTPVGGTEPQGRSLENASVLSKTKTSLKTLVRNLKELYTNQSNCDFTVIVRDQLFPAHKAILGARSSVFAAAFAHDTSENRSGIMDINDFQPDIVKDFLMYMYIGDVENLSWKNVFDLYAISDKYDVQDLKEECLEFMKSKVSLETVCEVLLLAEKYSEMELFELAKNFVTKWTAELLTSDHWKKFTSKNTLLAHEILKMIILDNSWRIK